MMGWGMTTGAGVGSLGGGAWGWVAGLLGLGFQLGVLGLVAVGIAWAVRSLGGPRRAATTTAAAGPMPEAGELPMRRVCQDCGQPARAEWHHCPHCGAPLE